MEKLLRDERTIPSEALKAALDAVHAIDFSKRYTRRYMSQRCGNEWSVRPGTPQATSKGEERLAPRATISRNRASCHR
jgi:hypothetical protein